MIIHDCEQGSDEWRALRLGKVTGSCFGKAIAGGQGKTKKTYMIQLIAERMSGEPQEGYSNAIMQRGNEIEPLAREYYEQATGQSVREVGFVERDEWIGFSPDGLIGDIGMQEIKSPNSSTHLEYILDNRLPPVYKAQVQGGLWVCERKWCDFISFDPRIKNKPYFCIRVERDEPYIKELNIKLKMFVTEMQELLEKLTVSPY